MRGTLAFLPDRERYPLALSGAQPPRSLEVVVPYSHPALAARALSAARELACGFGAAITLMAVHILPYPAELEIREGIRQRLEEELAAVARSCGVAVSVKLVFARSREEAYHSLLKPGSLVVIGAEERWWRSREERFARRLAELGHSVAVVRVK